MREIKFRVWIGTKMEYNIMAGFLGAFYVQGIDPKDTASMSPFNTKYDEHIQVMQFTGLTDKNGKEIYEGDIVETESMQGLKFPVIGIVNFGVEWKDFGEGLQVPDPRIYLDTRPFQKNNGSEFCIFHANPEVIGNIYENPTLLSPIKEK